MTASPSQFACLALSGGMDSSTLLLHLLAKGYQVTALSFLYGQKHRVEIDCAEKMVKYLQEQGHIIHHHLIHLQGLESLLFSALVEGGKAVPEGAYTADNMQDTVVPNRNKIFISILQSVALSIALKEQATTLVAMGVHAGDHAVYPDCRPRFIEADHQAFCLGNWQSDKVKNYLPYLHSDKYEVLRDGLNACEALNLDFDEVYKRTMTSYAPNSQGISDYKSGASLQRISAFMKLNRIDPLSYADETGIVDWETVTQFVKNNTRK